MQIPFSREKYLQLAKTQGYNTALTALHQDVEQWEFQAFEGPQGYQPQVWDELQQVRAFSRELWDQFTNAVKPLA